MAVDVLMSSSAFSWTDSMLKFGMVSPHMGPVSLLWFGYDKIDVLVQDYCVYVQ